MNYIYQKPRYFAFYLLLFSIPILVFEIDFLNVITQSSSQSSAVLDYILDNLETNPIQNLYFSNGTCLDGYEQASLGLWLGLEKQKTTMKSREIKINRDFQPRDIYKWRDKVICIQRNQKIDFMDSNFCRLGYKRCHDYVCVSQNESCPITGIKMLKTIDEKANYNEVFNLDSNSSLALVRNYHEQPILNISYSINAPPCYDKKKVPVESNLFFQPIDDLGCGYYGPNYENIEIERTLQTKFLDSNGLLAEIDSSTSGYLSFIKNDESILYYRRRASIDYTKIDCQYFIYGNPLESEANNIKSWTIRAIGLIVTEILILFFSFNKFICDRSKNVIYFIIAVCITVSINFLLQSMSYLIFVDELFELLNANIMHSELGRRKCFSNKILNNACNDFWEYQQDLTSLVLNCDVGFLLCTGRIIGVFGIAILDICCPKIKRLLERKLFSNNRSSLNRVLSEESIQLPLRRISSFMRPRLRTERSLSRNASQINLEELAD